MSPSYADDTFPSPSTLAGQWFPSLQWSLGVAQQQFTPCSNLTIHWSGGAAPFTLLSTWQQSGNGSDMDDLYQSGLYGNQYSWTLAVPANSNLFVQLNDSQGQSLSSQNEIQIIASGQGVQVDNWCLDARQQVDPSSSTLSSTSSTAQSSMPVSSAYSESSTNTTDLVSSTVAVKALIVACFLLLAFLGICGFFLLRVRRKYLSLQQKMTLYERQQGKNPIHEVDELGTQPALQSRGYLLSAQDAAFAVQTKSVENLSQDPFEDDAASVGLGTPSEVPSSAQVSNRHRFSTLSAIATLEDEDDGNDLTLAPSPRMPASRASVVSGVSNAHSQGGLSTGGVSAISNEFYHRTKATTILPKPSS